jgi:hypothetical protein
MKIGGVMKRFVGRAVAYFGAIVVGFYTSLVCQHLWNWFLAPAMHLDPISYWAMFGVSMLIREFMRNNTGIEEQRWEKLKLLLETCVPEDEKEAFHQVLKEEKENIWYLLVASVVGEFVGGTVTLIMGWGIYNFLT